RRRLAACRAHVLEPVVGSSRRQDLLAPGRWRRERRGLQADRAQEEDLMFLIAGTEEARSSRIVFIGKKGWSYDRPANLTGFDTKAEAEIEKMMLGVGTDIFRAVLSAPGPMSDIPPLKWLKVVEFTVKVPEPASESLFVIRAENKDGDVVWFGVDI